MPAWKREILERRKSKVSGAGSIGEKNTITASTHGDCDFHEKGRSSSKDDIRTAIPNGNSTITTVRQSSCKQSVGTSLSPGASTKTKHLWTVIESREPKSKGGESKEDKPQENLVLQESLGPLRENPFIRFEKERKRQLDRESSRPLQHILEIYGNVPGIRTIRAENIIIIESDSNYFQRSKSKFQNGVNDGSLNELLERRGCPVTEICAEEVVIYDTTLSKSEENLSFLGHAGPDVVHHSVSQGKVSRMLQKFNHNCGRLKFKSRSSESLLDLDSDFVTPTPSLTPTSDLVPNAIASSLPASPVQTSNDKPFIQSSLQSSEFMADLRLMETGRTTVPQQPLSTLRNMGGSTRDGRRIKINPESGKVAPSISTIEKEWDVNEARSGQAHHGERAHMSPTHPTFDIQPSPNLDVSPIPPKNLQAFALVNPRLQFRKTFTINPKSCRGVPSSPVSQKCTVNTPPFQETKSSLMKLPHPSEPDSFAPYSNVPTSLAMPTPAPPVSNNPKTASTPRAITLAPKLNIVSSICSPLSSDPTASASSSKTELLQLSLLPTATSLSLERQAIAEKLPITNIDDVEVEAAPGTSNASPVVQRRKGSNTFTVVPTRKPAMAESATDSVADAGKSPLAQVAVQLKKRYPGVDEIEVIGGYLTLDHSCLSKTGSRGKKLKISFNESSLQCTYEYPSESTAWDSEEEETPLRGAQISLPKLMDSSTSITSNNDLCSYMPKHPVDVGAWQDHKFKDTTSMDELPSQHANKLNQELMPGDRFVIADFSSEPALYF